MPLELWKLPVAATALIRDPVFARLPKKQCQLSLEFDDGDVEAKIHLIFNGVEAFKCTNLKLLTAEMIKSAYGKLIRLEGTPWLAESQSMYNRYPRSAGELQHMMICFDDGPCYEFICAGFEVS